MNGSLHKKIETENAPKAIGPYSQGITIPSQVKLMFVSGQLPIDPKTNTLVEGDIRVKAKKVLENIESILIAGGSSLDKVVRVDIFLKDIKNDFAAVNQIYAATFTHQPYPARQTIQVSDLPLGSSIEISCIAYA